LNSKEHKISDNPSAPENRAWEFCMNDLAKTNEILQLQPKCSIKHSSSHVTWICKIESSVLSENKDDVQ